MTFATDDRRILFTTRELVDAVVMQILRAASECSFEVIVYCAMPDHLHLVAHGLSESASLIEFVKQAKQLSSFHGKKIAGCRIWQPGYYERALRDDEDTRDVVAYILENPVRAGLVGHPADYPFSGSGVYTLAELLDFVQMRKRPT